MPNPTADPDMSNRTSNLRLVPHRGQHGALVLESFLLLDTAWNDHYQVMVETWAMAADYSMEDMHQSTIYNSVTAGADPRQEIL